MLITDYCYRDCKLQLGRREVCCDRHRCYSTISVKENKLIKALSINNWNIQNYIVIYVCFDYVFAHIFVIYFMVWSAIA